MARVLPLLVLSALCFDLSVGLSAFAAKKTDLEYWSGTGLGAQVLVDKIDLLEPSNCYADLKNFRGCVAALDSAAVTGDRPMRVIPSSLVEDTDFRVSAVIRDGLGLALVETKKANQEESLSLSTQREARVVKKRNAALEKVFLSARFSAGSEKSLLMNFEVVYKEILSTAKVPADKDPMTTGAVISAYLREAQDAHARIEPRARVEDDMRSGDENFTGVGMGLNKVGDRVIVSGVFEGSPSIKAGMRRNDVIVKVSNERGVFDVKGMKLEDVVAQIRGPIDTPVTLEFLRGNDLMSKAIVRGNIDQPNVAAKMVEDLGTKYAYIKLRTFSDATSCTKIEAKVKELEAAGAKGLIFDLRDDGGGLLSEAVCISGLFFGAKTVVKVKDLQADRFKDMNATKAAITNLPMVTLINASSASASEIVSGALQDHQRAWIVGERSFGKGTVQSPSLFFNDKILFYQTIQRFYQPSGRTNQIFGISPDLTVPVRPDATEDERFAVREADVFPGALESVGVEWKQTRPEAVKKISDCMASGQLAVRKYQAEEPVNAAADYQVMAAQEVLSCSAR